MADFVQMMKDWKRMCSEMEKLRPNDSCCGCPLEGYGCPAIYEDNSHMDYDDVEKNVTAWAAEHPEPVYPTWYEYLHSIGVFYKKHTAGGDVTEIHWGNLMTPIDADIAQKLGIEPKEG